MRDLDRVREKIDIRLEPRQVVLLAVATMLFSGALFAAGFMVGRNQAVQPARGVTGDLSRLDAEARAPRDAPGAPKTPVALGEVEFLFPSVLGSRPARKQRTNTAAAAERKAAARKVKEETAARRLAERKVQEAAEVADLAVQRAAAAEAAARAEADRRLAEEAAREQAELAAAEAARLADEESARRAAEEAERLAAEEAARQAAALAAIEEEPVPDPEPVAAAQPDEDAAAARRASEAAARAISDAARAMAAEKAAALQAAARGVVDSVAKVAAEKPKAPEPARPDPSSSRTRPKQWTLQVKASRDEDDAKQFAATLKKAGFEPHLVLAEIPGKGRYYRVRIGRFDSIELARAFQRRYKRSGRSDSGFITDL